MIKNLIHVNTYLKAVLKTNWNELRLRKRLLAPTCRKSFIMGIISYIIKHLIVDCEISKHLTV